MREREERKQQDYHALNSCQTETRFIESSVIATIGAVFVRDYMIANEDRRINLKITSASWTLSTPKRVLFSSLVSPSPFVLAKLNHSVSSILQTNV